MIHKTLVLHEQKTPDEDIELLWFNCSIDLSKISFWAEIIVNDNNECTEVMIDNGQAVVIKDNYEDFTLSMDSYHRTQATKERNLYKLGPK